MSYLLLITKTRNPDKGPPPGPYHIRTRTTCLFHATVLFNNLPRLLGPTGSNLSCPTASDPRHQLLQLLGPPGLDLLPSAAPPLSPGSSRLPPQTLAHVTPLLRKSSLPPLVPHPVALQGSLSRPEASAWHPPGPQGHRTAELSEFTSSPNHKCVTPQPGYIPFTSNLSLAFIPQPLPECL